MILLIPNQARMTLMPVALMLSATFREGAIDVAGAVARQFWRAIGSFWEIVDMLSIFGWSRALISQILGGLVAIMVIFVDFVVQMIQEFYAIMAASIEYLF